MDIYIVTGFTGSGKTTFLNQYLPLLYGKTAVIENETGEVCLDETLFADAGLVSRLPSGCICCTLALDLKAKLLEIYEKYQPDRVFIEPSGVGRLSDVARVCNEVRDESACDIGRIRRITLVDASVFEDYLEDFGDFYRDQIEYADTILFSYIEDIPEKEKRQVIECIHKMNPGSNEYEYDWRKLFGAELMELIEQNGYEGKEPEEEQIITGLSGHGIRNKRRRNLWER